MPAPQRRLDEHGFPIPATFDDAPAGPRWSPQQTRFLRGVLAVLVVLVVGSIAVGPQLKQWAAVSMAQWHSQRAIDQYLDGDLRGAQEELSDAIYWLPDSASLYELRATYREEAQDLDGAIADLNSVLQINPTYSRAYMARSWLRCRQGKFAECLADSNAAVQNSHNNDFRTLNHRAYMRALTHQELPEGLADAEQAVKAAEQKEDELPSVLDTRGYLRHLLGDGEGALADLNKAIALVERQRATLDALVNRRRLDPREVSRITDHLNRDLAVMYHHRGEAEKKLGHDERAAADLQRADELGFDPDKGVF